MSFSFELELRRAERAINNLVDVVNQNGGSMYIVDKSNPDFCIKLDRPIGISYFVPVRRETDEFEC